jgi:hypothetical protein
MPYFVRMPSDNQRACQWELRDFIDRQHGPRTMTRRVDMHKS